MPEDSTYTAREKAKIQGYLKKWNTSKLVFEVVSFIDLLMIPSILSLGFQKENVNPVEPVKAFDTDSKRLELFIKKDSEKLPNVRGFLSKVKEDGGEYSYQGVKLRNFETVKSASMKN